MRRVLFVFVDGVGLGDADESYNPFMIARLPVLAALLGGRTPVLESAPFHGAEASIVALDASFGVPGLPQSGTGQAALLTGQDTVRIHGRHFGPWVPTTLRELLRTQSVLARALQAGRRVAFANAYPEELVALATTGVGDRSRVPAFLRAGPPLAALGAGILDRGTAHLERGDAVASEITNEGWRDRLGRSTLPIISAADAGRNLARIAATQGLTLFAHYATDYAGHARDREQAVAALERVDAFLGGITAAADDLLLVVASDHGNIEDLRHGHTHNPALAIVHGPGHAAFASRLTSLADVTPALLDYLRIH